MRSKINSGMWLGLVAVATAASGALADGMPGRPAAATAAVDYTQPAMNWSGFYVGGHGGYGFGTVDRTSISTLGTFNQSFDVDNWAGGVQAGVQHQWGSTVAGLEVSWTGGGFNSYLNDAPLDRHVVEKLNSILMITGRLGYASQNWLAYIKGGYASAKVEFDALTLASDKVVTGFGPRREDGWTIGTGFEIAVAPAVTLGLEYDYLNFDIGSRNSPDFAINAKAAQSSFRDASADLHLFTARLNFQLGDRQPRAEMAGAPLK